MSILRVKDDSVCLVGLVPQMTLALQICHSVLRHSGNKSDTVITSANDGKHSLTSLHYDGRAVDLRSNWYLGDRRLLARAMKKALGLDFDVVWETKRDDQGAIISEHFHIEWQPRRR